MKRFNDYEKTQAYTNNAKLPAGGYVLKIQKVRFEEGQNGNSDRLILMFDILEGDYKQFFKHNYDAQVGEDKKWKGTIRVYCPNDDGSEQDQWTKKRFKTVINHFEASNPGYAWNWDENTLKDKVIGGLFGEINTVIENKEVSYVGFRFTETADNIRNNTFKVPAPQFKNGAANKKAASVDEDGFANISENTDEEIPF